MQHRREHVLERRARVAAMYCQGRYQSEIAREVGCSQQQVSSDLRILQQQWQQSALVDTQTLQARELQRLDTIEREAWECFVRSKENTESTVKERNNGRDKVSIKTEKHVGDPRWLQIVLNCIDHRCQILGVHAAKKFTLDWDSLSDYQMERISRGDPLMAVLTEPAQPPSLPQSPIAEA